MISTTLTRVELLWTTISRMRGNSFMKRMKVKITPPIRAWERISPEMYRFRMRTDRLCG
jgi:hypothetical protein